MTGAVAGGPALRLVRGVQQPQLPLLCPECDLPARVAWGHTFGCGVMFPEYLVHVALYKPCGHLLALSVRRRVIPGGMS